MARLIDTGPQVEGGASRASVTIQPLTRVDSSMLQRLITGYETDEIYRVATSETDALTSFDLRLTPAPQR